MLLLSAVGADATPFRPVDDHQIIEHIIRTPLDISGAQVRARRAALAQHPTDIPLAISTAHGFILQARAAGDPRYLGYAQAALNPWWKDSNAPRDVAVLRATIKQSNHEFNPALTDLNAVLAKDPADVQAHLTRAAIYGVQARYPQARGDCAKLLFISDPFVGALCLANIAHLAGQTKAQYALLMRTLGRNASLPPEQLRSAYTLLAEMAARLGETAEAEAHFKTAYRSGPDAYLESAYADFLLDARRPRDVLQLLGPGALNDGALLRRALAQKMLGDPGLNTTVADLRARYDASLARGDRVHQREFARFALYLKNNPTEALQLAQQNWQVQREPADARILLEAALAAHDSAAAQPAVEWVAQTRIEDMRLRLLAQRASGGRAT